MFVIRVSFKFAVPLFRRFLLAFTTADCLDLREACSGRSGNRKSISPSRPTRVLSVTIIPPKLLIFSFICCLGDG